MSRTEAVQRLRAMKGKAEVAVRNAYGHPSGQTHQERVDALEYALRAIDRCESLCEDLEK